MPTSRRECTGLGGALARGERAQTRSATPITAPLHARFATHLVQLYILFPLNRLQTYFRQLIRHSGG